MIGAKEEDHQDQRDEIAMHVASVSLGGAGPGRWWWWSSENVKLRRPYMLWRLGIQRARQVTDYTARPLNILYTTTF